MTAIEVPITVFATLAIGLAILIIAVISEWKVSQGKQTCEPAEQDVQSPETHLIELYLTGHRELFQKTYSALKKSSADKSNEKLLSAICVAIPVYPNSLDKLYCLRGIVLRDMELEMEAGFAFRQAIRANQENVEARMMMVIHYMKKKMFGSASREIEKTLRADNAPVALAKYETLNTQSRFTRVGSY